MLRTEKARVFSEKMISSKRNISVSLPLSYGSWPILFFPTREN